MGVDSSRLVDPAALDEPEEFDYNPNMTHGTAIGLLISWGGLGGQCIGTYMAVPDRSCLGNTTWLGLPGSDCRELRPRVVDWGVCLGRQSYGSSKQVMSIGYNDPLFRGGLSTCDGG